MSRINHDRPQLRFLDNLRRELGKASAFQQGQTTDFQWPAFLRPVAAKPKALAALFSLIGSLSAWLDDDNLQFALNNSPDYVKSACRSFATANVYNKYDPSYTGRDWLADMADGSVEHREFLEFILRFVEEA